MPSIVSSSIQEVINAIQDVMLTVSGIRAAPDYAPEDLGSLFPFSAVYLENGTWTVGPGYSAMTGLVTIAIEVHVARKSLPADLRQVMPFSVSVPKALLSPSNITFGGRIDGFNGLAFTFGPLTWGTTQTLGFKYTFMGKLLLATS